MVAVCGGGGWLRSAVAGMTLHIVVLNQAL